MARHHCGAAERAGRGRVGRLHTGHCAYIRRRPQRRAGPGQRHRSGHLSGVHRNTHLPPAEAGDDFKSGAITELHNSKDNQIGGDTAQIRGWGRQRRSLCVGPPDARTAVEARRVPLAARLRATADQEVGAARQRAHPPSANKEDKQRPSVALTPPRAGRLVRPPGCRPLMASTACVSRTTAA